jgi:hypothetical protein
MYSLTINFGPSGSAWAFLFKDKEKADAAYANMCKEIPISPIEDDFGQKASFKIATIHGIVLEDLDLIEAARIQRSLAEERVKIKFVAAAKSDPVIGPAARGQGPGVLTPMGGGFRG